MFHLACIFAAVATISNTSELASALLSDDVDRHFALTGTVASAYSYSNEIIIQDATCAVRIIVPPSSECSPGDLVRATGRTVSDVTGGTDARCIDFETIARYPPPVPVELTSPS